MIAFIGLGNVGEKYAQTKHNAGFWVIDKFAQRRKISFSNGKGDYVYAFTKRNKVILIKPTTGMNNSGMAVKQVAKKWKLEPQHIYIIVDDIDIPLGSIRIRPRGGDGCHRGLENIIYQLKSNEFPRIRFGIGTDSNMRPSEKYVLKPFFKDQFSKAELMVNNCADALQSILARGLDYGMNHYNS